MAEHNHGPGMTTTACPECMKNGEQDRQRMVRGFSDEDCWSLDAYLATVIAGSVKVLRENLHGCPPELCEGGDVDLGVKRWEAILDEIVLGFDAYTDTDGDRITDPVPPEFGRAFDLLREWWGHLWD